MKFSLLNARSLKANEFIIRNELDSSDAEFTVITETWLKNMIDQKWTECCQFNNSGYRILTYSRQSRTGGLALIYKDKHNVEELEKGQKQSFEYLICSIKLRGTATTLAIICHPGYSKVSRVTVTTFIDELTQFIPKIIMNYKNAIILGDFNLHLDTDDPNAGMFADTLDAMGLTEHVNFQTHRAGHTLDQIYSVLDNPVTVFSVAQGPLILDHNIIHGHITIPRNATITRTVVSRKFNEIDCDKFMDDIELNRISFDNIDEAVRSFDTELTRILDLHAPLKTRKVTECKKEPWYEEHAKHKKKLVRN